MGHCRQSTGCVGLVALSQRRRRGRTGVSLATALLLGLSVTAFSAGADETEEPGLGLVNLDLLDSRDGFAIPQESRFVPGETVHLYFQIRGYRVGDADRVHLRYELEALDPAGRRFYWDDEGDFDVELAPQDKNWMPVVRYSPRIPNHAGGGTYSIGIVVEDVLAGTVIETDVPIEVDGTRMGPADELTVHQFHFSRMEDGDRLAEPVFSAGDAIWAAFFITGYEMREDNSFEVESDAFVVNEFGERMFAFQSVGGQGRPFYPRLWLPARIRLDLDEDMPPGDYEVVLNVRDGVAGADATRRYGFRVL